MPWVNLDDGFTDDPRVDALSDAAVRLHVAGLCYCSRHLTDGLVPAERVPRLVPRFKRTSLTELVDTGLWRELVDNAAYKLPDYLAWNRTRVQVEEDRQRLKKVRSEAAARGNHAKWHEGQFEDCERCRRLSQT